MEAQVRRPHPKLRTGQASRARGTAKGRSPLTACTSRHRVSGARSQSSGDRQGVAPLPTLRHPGPRASDVRGFDGSRGLVCHTTFHSLLRSSSMPEPRRPPRRCLWTRLGAGTPRCLSALAVHGGGTPLGAFLACPASPPCVVFSAVWQPRRERRLPSALPQRAFGTDSSTPSPPVSLPVLPFLVEPPASLVRSGQGQTTTLSLCLCPPTPLAGWTADEV